MPTEQAANPTSEHHETRRLIDSLTMQGNTVQNLIAAEKTEIEHPIVGITLNVMACVTAALAIGVVWVLTRAIFQ